MLLPQPDSPTKPNPSPCFISKLTSLTAFNTPLGVKKNVLRFIYIHDYALYKETDKLERVKNLDIKDDYKLLIKTNLDEDKDCMNFQIELSPALHNLLKNVCIDELTHASVDTGGNNLTFMY